MAVVVVVSSYGPTEPIAFYPLFTFSIREQRESLTDDYGRHFNRPNIIPVTSSISLITTRENCLVTSFFFSYHIIPDDPGELILEKKTKSIHHVTKHEILNKKLTVGKQAELADQGSSELQAAASRTVFSAVTVDCSDLQSAAIPRQSQIFAASTIQCTQLSYN